MFAILIDYFWALLDTYLHFWRGTGDISFVTTAELVIYSSEARLLLPVDAAQGC